jgi:hypothetical protein
MAQVVSRRPLNAEARLSARVCPYGIRDGQRRTGTGFSPSSLVSPVSIIPPGLYFPQTFLGDCLYNRLPSRSPSQPPPKP